MGNLKLKKFYDRILISNASAQANGVYVFSGIGINGTPSYYKGAGNIYEWAIGAGKENDETPFRWAIYVIGLGSYYYSTNSSFNSVLDLPAYPWECSGWVDQNSNPVNIKLEPYSSLTKNSISIKRQNLTSLKVGGGTTVNNPSSVYVFKGGSINTLANIFNPINFQVNDTILITSLELFLNDDYDFLFQVDDYGAGKYWRNEQTNMNNYVIPVNYIIYFNTSNNNNIQVSNGAIIQKYNSGKITLKKS